MVKIKSKKTSTKTSNKIDASNSENKQTLNYSETLQQSQSDLPTFFKKLFEKFKSWFSLNSEINKTSSVKKIFSLLGIFIAGLIAFPFIISIIAIMFALFMFFTAIIFSLFVVTISILIALTIAGGAMIASGFTLLFNPDLLHDSDYFVFYLTADHPLSPIALISLGLLFIIPSGLLLATFFLFWFKNFQTLSNYFGKYTKKLSSKCFQAIWKNIKKLSNNN